MVVSSEMNLSEVRKIFNEEFKFITQAFSRCQWPKPVESDNEAESGEDEEETPFKAVGDIKKENENLPSRAETIEELLQKQEQLKTKENRKRKKEEEPKKCKNKKKKKKASNENSVKADSCDVEIINDESLKEENKERVKEEIKNKKEDITKRTRAPIKYGADVVVNKEGSMLFSNLAFTDNVDDLKPKVGGPKQPKHVLGKLQKMNNFISSLEERGKKEKAQRLKENMSWSNAFFKAEGAKVKDDTNKVMKSVKQLEKRKRASERKWKNRLEEIDTKKDRKQKKRDTHIQKRVDQKKERKLKKLIKRGRFIPDLKNKS